MDIALVTPRYPPTYAGGGEISAQLLADQLSERRWVDGITVYSFDGETTETVDGVTVRRLGDVPQYPYTLPNELAYRRLRGLELDCDLLHAYNMHLHPAVGRLAARWEIPSVATLNAYPLVDWEDIGVTPSLKRRAYERTVLRLERPRLTRLMRNIDVFLPLSGAVEHVYRERGFADSEFEVIPNMLDPSFKIPDGDVDAPDNASVRLLYVGYLRDSKGVRFLVDAVERLPSTYSLTVVGGGPEHDSLVERASRVNAADRITFTGRIPYEEVTRAYADADVFVHPGVWPEPFGRTILEAMQAGLPVVATSVGGPAETVPQPELLCEPEDPDALYNSIKSAAADHDRIGAENADWVRQEYHPDVVVPQFRRVYERVLADSR